MYMARGELSVSLGQFTSVFKVEVYVIKACALENMDRGYKNRNSQDTIKVRDDYRINSKLVRDCHQSLMELGEYSRAQLGCQVTEELRIIKLATSWQNWDLNIHL
jgi:hypothetical protein